MINVQKLKKSDNLCWFRIHDLNSENPFPFSLGKIFPACFGFNIKLQNQIYDPKWLFYCQKWPLEIPYPAQISELLSRLTQIFSNKFTVSTVSKIRNFIETSGLIRGW